MDTRVKTYSYADVMLAHTPVGIAIYDACDLRLLEANALFREVIDKFISPCSGEGRPLADRAPEGWIPEAWEAGIVDILRAVAQTGVPYRGQEFAFRSPIRGLTYWNWSVDAVRDQDGRITHLVQTVSEVTDQILERQQAEQARSALRRENTLVEEERKRLEVIETVARSVRIPLDAQQIARVALDAIYDNLNATSTCLHTALPEQRALRSLCSRIRPDIDEEALSATRYLPYERLTATRQATIARDPIVIEDFQAAIAEGKVSTQSPSLHALQLIGTRGYICVPLWFGDHFEGTLCATFAHVISADGPEMRVLVSAGTHIAAALAHARLHATIENERTRLKAILDHLPDGILIAEASSGAISYANPAAASLLGIPLSDLTAMPLHRHLWFQVDQETPPTAQYTPPWNFMVIRALSGEAPRSKETIVVRSDGSKSVTLTSSAPLYNENGILTGAVVVFQDITEQKRFEQQKNDFFSIANHELRTPITIIQGFAEILQIAAAPSTERQSEEAALTEYALTNIMEQSQHLTRLIEQMLDISRIEHIQFTLQRAPHDLLQMLRHVIESQAITTKRHHLRLTLDGIEADATLLANIDGERITQVLHNLISNAIKYSPCGEIEVGLRCCRDASDEALIWVKDHGPGIPAHELPLIFKRFYRASDIDRSLSGFGIGLYLVREVVRCHGGHVWVESAEGQGSTFYVSLPLNPADTSF